MYFYFQSSSKVYNFFLFQTIGQEKLSLTCQIKYCISNNKGIFSLWTKKVLTWKPLPTDIFIIWTARNKNHF